jgi:hypothetical protein
VYNPDQLDEVDGDGTGDVCDGELLRGGGSRCDAVPAASGWFGVLIALAVASLRRARD